MQALHNAYLAARNAQLTELATKYGRGLDSRLNQAADAGDLKLTATFDEEKARVEALVTAMSAPADDPLSAARETVALPDLPVDSPESLATLRQTFEAESGKILSSLDTALQQSLRALESELTRARDLDNAKAVLAYRESLGAGEVEVTMVAEGEAETTPDSTVAIHGREPRTMASTTDDPARATKDAPFENSLGMKFVPVPGTDVLFCIHETRRRDFAPFAEEVPDIHPNWKITTLGGFTITERVEDHPVGVSFGEAQAFCEWLSKREGKAYRLPTDQEWSVAVGIGKWEKWRRGVTPSTIEKPQDIFPWGTEWPPPPGAGKFSNESRKAKSSVADGQYIEGYDDGFPTTAPVMSFSPNSLGIYDLAGNVTEWVEDWWSGNGGEKMHRGGSSTSYAPESLFSSFRYRRVPDDQRTNTGGFRVVVER